MFASIKTAAINAKNAVVNAAAKVPNGVYVGAAVTAAAVAGIVLEKKFGVVSATGNVASNIFGKTAEAASAAAEATAS